MNGLSLVLVSAKKVILNLRLRPETRDEFAVAADMRGASMSSLLHQFVVKTIREEKERDRAEFDRKLAKLAQVESLDKLQIVGRPMPPEMPFFDETEIMSETERPGRVFEVGEVKDLNEQNELKNAPDRPKRKFKNL